MEIKAVRLDTRDGQKIPALLVTEKLDEGQKEQIKEKGLKIFEIRSLLNKPWTLEESVYIDYWGALIVEKERIQFPYESEDPHLEIKKVVELKDSVCQKRYGFNSELIKFK